MRNMCASSASKLLNERRTISNSLLATGSNMAIRGYHILQAEKFSEKTFLFDAIRSVNCERDQQSLKVHL